MTYLGIILVWMSGIGALYFTVYVWGRLFVWRTDDTKTLHKYQRFIIWGPLALKKLETIYERQLEQCTISADAEKVKRAIRHILPDLYSRAYQKWDELAVIETRKEIEDAREDEGKLLNLLKEKSWHHSPAVRMLECSVIEALRPFTEKRIREASTVYELAELGRKPIKNMFSFGEEICRIDDSMKDLYSLKLKQLVLNEVIKTLVIEESTKLCFKVKTGDDTVDRLVEMKRDALDGTISEKFLPNINFELQLALGEYQKEALVYGFS